MQGRCNRAHAGFELGGNARGRSSRLVPVHDRSLDGRGLHQVLGHMSWTKIWTACFGSKLSLYINTCVSGQLSGNSGEVQDER